MMQKNYYTAKFADGTETTFIANTKGFAENVARNIIKNKVISLKRVYKSGRIGKEILNRHIDEFNRALVEKGIA